jgi:carboxymethylenebutenolidase
MARATPPPARDAAIRAQGLDSGARRTGSSPDTIVAVTVAIQQLMWEIERLRDAFHEAVYVRRDVSAALEVAREDCSLVNTPVGTGTEKAGDLRRYLADDVLPHLPDDLAFRRVSRTVDKFRVVEESIVRFTHDRELPWLLPGAAPTHRRAEVVAISITTFMHSRVNAHRTRSLMAASRTLWDHVTLVAQLGAR